MINNWRRKKLKWNQVLPHWVVIVAKDDAVEDSVQRDESNRDDAFVGDDKYSCDCSNCSMFETLCDKDCKRRYLMVANVVAPCVASKLALCSIICHTRRTDDKRSKEVAMISDLIRFRHFHHFHHALLRLLHSLPKNIKMSHACVAWVCL